MGPDGTGTPFVRAQAVSKRRAGRNTGGHEPQGAGRGGALEPRAPRQPRQLPPGHSLVGAPPQPGAGDQRAASSPAGLKQR